MTGQDRDAASPPSTARGDSPTVASTTKLRVLLVDDNEDAVRSLERMLNLLGYDVVAATHGQEALALGRVHQPHLALLDLGMPDMNGYEVARAIRSEPWGVATRMIALTGWGQPEDIQRSMAEGFEAHLVKPIKTFELLRVMGKPVP